MANARKYPSVGAVPNPANTASALGDLPILTKEQACQLLACKPRYLERAIRSGRLRACKPTGKFVRIFRKDIDAFLERCASIAA